MSQTLLGNQIGKRQQTISKYLSAQMRPGWQTAKKLAAVLGTTPDFWLEASSREMKKVFKQWSVQEKRKRIDAALEPCLEVNQTKQTRSQGVKRTKEKAASAKAAPNQNSLN